MELELLSPAGNLEKLKMAVLYGADAVYLGGQRFGLRAGADNFTMEEMAEGVAFAHERGVKVYVTVNLIPHNEDLIGLPEYLQDLAGMQVDGLIVSDPAVLALAKTHAPQIPIHLSTQANCVNYASARFWYDLGVRRIVVARELSLPEIQEIRDKTPPDLELEAFVHGAMCISYSGRCLLSMYMIGRDANRGECAHPCRYRYALMEEKRPGQYFPIEEDGKLTTIMNSKDLCMLPHLPDLIKAGVTSFKIEGRMKSIHYVATVTAAYRHALDGIRREGDRYRFDPHLLEEVKKSTNRDFTTGFYFGRPSREDHIYEGEAYLRPYDFIGVVLDYNQETGMALVEQRNNFKVGDEVEIVGPDLKPFTFTLTAMWNEEGEAVTVAPHARQRVRLSIGKQRVKPYDLLRRKAKEEHDIHA